MVSVQNQHAGDDEGQQTLHVPCGRTFLTEIAVKDGAGRPIIIRTKVRIPPGAQDKFELFSESNVLCRLAVGVCVQPSCVYARTRMTTCTLEIL